MDEFKERLTNFYNKFNENKRLDTRHGQVEFLTCVKYMEEYLNDNDSIVDIGSGPGKYSLYFKNKGYDVTAVEYVRPNIGMLKAKDKEIRIVEASATDLSMFKDNQFDVSILFGPMYHLYSKQDKLKALLEAKRITKKYIFISYIMNEYSVIEYAFIDNHYHEVKDKLTFDYHIDDPSALFFQSRIEDLDELNKLADLDLVKRFAADGPSDYIRSVINKMDEETFNGYLDFHFKTCERKELLGASSHVVDILEKRSV